MLQSLLPFIEVKAYDPLQEIKGTPWKRWKTDPPGDNFAKRSDAFRFLALYKYGGLYFDLDVMFLKDFDVLRDTPFCYAWESRPFVNSALLHTRHFFPAVVPITGIINRKHPSNSFFGIFEKEFNQLLQIQ